jgi:hypothetical protein
MSFILLGILNSQAAGAVAAGVAGYWALGASGGGVDRDGIYKLDFTTEALTLLATTFSDARVTSAGFADSGVAGYCAGGMDGSTGVEVSTIDKLAFPAETASTLGTGLSSNRGNLSSGFANKAVAGYIAGGMQSTQTVRVATVDKITFPTDFRSTLATGLSGARQGPTGMANNGVAGYVAGGREPSPTNYVTTVDKFAFPSDTRSTLATGLSGTNGLSAGFANNGVAGYIANGVIGTTCNKFAFPSDTRSIFATTNSGYWTAGFSNNAVAGYVSGGISDYTRVEKIAFPSDTVSSVGTFVGGTSNHSGFADQGL